MNSRIEIQHLEFSILYTYDMKIRSKVNSSKLILDLFVYDGLQRRSSRCPGRFRIDLTFDQIRHEILGDESFERYRIVGSEL